MFKKSFPRTLGKGLYPQWEEIVLSDADEQLVEANARVENMRIMDQCLSDAMQIFEKKKLKPYQTDLVQVAIALFDKRSSHVVFHKETAAKERFDAWVKEQEKKEK